MATPRKCLENQKGRKSAKRKATASTAPVPMGKPISKIPADVAADKVAAEKWAGITAAYKESGYIPTLGDVEALTRLCLLYSEAAALRALVAKITAAARNSGVVDDAFMDLHRLLDGKRRLIVPLEDRLFLNPVARMRGLPTQKKEKITPENLKQYAERL